MGELNRRNREHGQKRSQETGELFDTPNRTLAEVKVLGHEFRVPTSLRGRHKLSRKPRQFMPPLRRRGSPEPEKDRCYRVWVKEIINFRRRIKRILKDSPSLKNYLVDFYPEAFRDAVYAESKEFDLPANVEVSLQEALDKEI